MGGKILMNNADVIVSASEEKYLLHMMGTPLTDEDIQKIREHKTKFSLGKEKGVCAWYKDLDDFFSDWCGIGYTKEEAGKLLFADSGEFMFLPKDKGIIRFAEGVRALF